MMAVTSVQGLAHAWRSPIDPTAYDGSIELEPVERWVIKPLLHLGAYSKPDAVLSRLKAADRLVRPLEGAPDAVGAHLKVRRRAVIALLAHCAATDMAFWGLRHSDADQAHGCLPFCRYLDRNLGVIQVLIDRTAVES